MHFAFRDTDQLVSLLLDAEAGQRGYLLTGSKVYLKPYEAALAALPNTLAQFEASSRTTGFEAVTAERLRSEALQKMAELATTIRLYRSKGRAAAMDMVNTNRGNDVMMQARRDAKELHEAYFAGILRDSGRLEGSNRKALMVSFSGNLTAIALLVLVSVRLNRAFARIGQLVSQLSLSEQNYQLLVQRCESVREDERASLAREIHDALGGALTSIKFGLMTARNDAQEHGASKAVLRVAEASSDIDSTIRSLRRIASALRPPLLDQVGLVAALEAYAREFAERTGIKVSCDFPVTSLRLPADQSIGLYRIVQEALTNVARHSHASSVEISMVSDGGRLLLRVQDDGVGFDRSEASGKQSLGLLGMQERAKLAGAELAIESAPKKGTSISAVLMLPSTESVPSYSR